MADFSEDSKKSIDERVSPRLPSQPTGMIRADGRIENVTLNPSTTPELFLCLRINRGVDILQYGAGTKTASPGSHMQCSIDSRQLVAPEATTI